MQILIKMNLQESLKQMLVCKTDEGQQWLFFFANLTGSFMKGETLMSCIKRWFEEHISEMTDKELLESGYSQDEINFLRESFQGKKESSK